MLLHAFILIVCSVLNLFLSFVFSLIETSLIITDDVKMRIIIKRCAIASQRRRLIKILEKRDAHGAALSVAITLTNVTGSSILGSMASHFLPSQYIILFTILITYFMLIFARTVPKIYARSISDKVVMKFSWLIRDTYIITYPILHLTLIWLKIFGLQKSSKNMSISELKDIISIYREHGVIGNHEGKIMESVFSVKNKMIENFVYKEKEIHTLDANTPLESYRSIIKKYKRKKFFIEQDGVLIGIALQRDLLSALLTDKKKNLVLSFTKRAIHVSGTERLVDIVIKMERDKISQAIIMDGAGEAIGILSIKDIYMLLTRGRIVESTSE